MAFLQRSELALIPTPESTQTWSPVPHVEAIDRLYNQLDQIGIGVRQDRYEVVGTKGERLFASFTLDQKIEGIEYMVGLRNSHDKAFSLGVTAGNHICVCSNMVFNGAFIEMRRHTSGLTMDTVNELLQRAIGNILSNAKEGIDWQLQLKDVPVQEDTIKCLTYDAMVAGIISPSKFTAFHKDLGEERNLYGDNLFAWHGGVTRSIRGLNLFGINDRSRKLHSFIDNYLEEPIEI